MDQLHELIQPSYRIQAIERHTCCSSLYDTVRQYELRLAEVGRTVAVHESAFTALKLRISVGSNGLITDILTNRWRCAQRQQSN
jgi:hypothetical protein